MVVQGLNVFILFQTPASGFPGVQDDLVFSGAGSGCNADDEDQCTPVFETGSGKLNHNIYNKEPHRQFPYVTFLINYVR